MASPGWGAGTGTGWRRRRGVRCRSSRPGTGCLIAYAWHERCYDLANHHQLFILLLPGDRCCACMPAPAREAKEGGATPQPPLPVRPPKESICPGLQSGTQSGMDITEIRLLVTARLCSQSLWVLILPLPLSSCENFVESLNISQFQFLIPKIKKKNPVRERARV